MESALPTFLLGINSHTARHFQGKTKCKTHSDKCTLPAAHLVPTLSHTARYLQGKTKCKTWSDKWTVVTADGGLAAQYEHTILITPDGAEILTKTD